MQYKLNTNILLLFTIFLLKTLAWHIITQEFREITSASFDLTGWTINGNPLTISNIINECQTTFVKMEKNNKLEKSYSIQYHEFSQIRVEMNAYFYNVVDSSVQIEFSGNNEIYELIAANSITTTTLCSNSAPSAQYLLNYIGSSSSSEFILQITFSFPSAGNLASFLGIRDIIIFTDSAVAMNGCPLELPILDVTGTCAAKCEDYGQQLSGHYLNKCLVPDDINGVARRDVSPTVYDYGFNIDENYLNAQVSYFRSTDYTSSTTDYIFSDILFSQLQTIQIQGSIYLIDWEAASSVTINVNDESDMFTISQIGSEFITNPPSSIQPCTITLTDNSKVQTQTSEINSQILLDISSQFMILLIQSLSSVQATYAFSNFYTYNAQPTKYCNNFAYNTFCMSCDSPYWAYRGQCDDSCPPYTKSDFENRRCIDLSEYETKENIPDIAANAKGYYLAKITKDDLAIQNSDIQSLFSTVPLETDNYQNGQKYSLLPDKKMIGGYNSWRYGIYQLSYTQLPTHYQIRIFADLYLLDGWTATDQFIITLDSTTETTTIAGLQSQGLYGLPEVDYFTSIFYRVPHTSDALDVIFQCRGITVDSTQASCGMTNLFIMYDVDVTTLCTSTTPYQFWSFVTNKCEDCDASCQTGCQLESTQCNGCHYSCQSCNTGTTASDCQSCSSAFHRSLVGTECQCDSGYVDSGYGMCSTVTGCHYSCASCYKSNDANSCASCPDSSTSFRLAGTNQDCVCQSGYEDTGNQICSEQSNCHFSCATCSDDSSTGCLTCPDNSTSHRTIDSGAHTCSCDAGYQESSPDSPTCIKIDPCDISCSLCSIVSSPTSCVTCPDNPTSHRTYNSGSHTCPCDTNYIETDPVSANCAMQCHKSCALCSAPNSSTNCSTCGDNSTTHRTFDGSNGCPCDDGYEEQNPINANCIVISPCHYTCELCSSSSDSNTCVSCPDNSVSHRTLVGSVCQCDSGYQDTTSQQNCVIQCHYSCETCSSPNSSTNCDSCIPAATSHRNYDNSAHTCNCENGYIEDGTNPNCKMDCHYSCLTCSSPQDQNKCSSCDNSMNRISGTNSDCPCKPGYEDLSNAALCTAINPCHETCDLCSVISSSNSCISCVPSQFRELNGSNECVCINGYQEQIGNPICSIQCHFTCLTCSIPNDANGCTTCPSSSTSHRINGKNNDCVCEVGYVEISNQLLCQMQCHFSCDACSFFNDQNACTQCNSSSHRSLVNQSCVCDNGYKEVIGQQNCILDCHFSCYTCSEAYLQNKCLDCPDQSISHRMKDNNDQCICLTGYKEINQTNCEPICHTTCLTCYDVGENNCLSCDQSQNRTLNDGQCICQAGYQANGAQCQVICHSSCLTCSGPLANQCLSCQISDISHRELYQNECKCQNDYMEVVGSAYCQLICMELCATCNVKDECLTCKSIDHLELQKSQCICADGYYLSNTKTLCLECSQNCSTCSAYDKCTSCNSEQNKSLANNKCVCKDQYWMKDDNSNCISCNEDDGWLNEQCIKRDCGDGVYTFGEQCDDNNDDPRDGCDHCVRVQGFTCLNKPLQQSQCIKCGDNCKECMMDGKCILCNQGSQLENGNCQKCQDNCEVCKNQKCFKCLVIPQFISDNLTDNEKSNCPLCEDIEGLYTNPDGTDCIAKCGDQIVVSNAGEQCDDGNTIDNDGCSSLCQIEEGFECQDTQCIAIYPPTPSLISIQPPNNYTQERVFMLTYDSSLSSSVNVTNYLRFEIDGKYQNEDYFIQIQEQFNEFYQLKITLKLENSFIDDQFIILFENVEQIVGNNGLSQEIQSLSIGIYDFEYVSENVKLATQQVSDLNQYALYVLAAMICLAILLGGIDTFWNLLDLVQLLSYTNFIDTRYPYNLSKFLELFEFGQLRFLDNLIKMSALMELNIDSIELESYKPKGIFSNQVDTGLFIINISSTVTAFVIVFALYMACTILLKVLTPIINKLQTRYIKNESILKKLLKFQQSILGYFELYQKQFFWNVLIRTHMSTAYDISLAVFLQLQFDYSDMQSTIAKGSYILCGFTCVLQVTGVFFYLTKINISMAQFQQSEFKNNYGEALFDTLEVKQLGKIKTYYNVFLLTKRFFHMLFLTYLRNVPSMQSVCIGLLGMVHILFLLFTHPLEQKAEFIKQLQCEVLMYVMHMQVFFLTFDDQLQLLSESGRLLVGWICIGEISLIVVIQLLIDIVQQFKYLIENVPFFSKLYKMIVQKYFESRSRQNEQI